MFCVYDDAVQSAGASPSCVHSREHEAQVGPPAIAGAEFALRERDAQRDEDDILHHELERVVLQGVRASGEAVRQ